MVEAEEAVGVAGRRGAVVEAAEREAVEVAGHVEGGERLRIAARSRSRRTMWSPSADGHLVFADQRHAHALDGLEVVVEGRCGFGVA